MECNFSQRHHSIANVKRLLYIFALALTVSEILTFLIFDLKILGQDHGV